MPGIVVAIDGGAGTGKSTTAKGVARRLGFFYLDTGAMYRAATLKYLKLGRAADNIEMSTIQNVISGSKIILMPGEQGVKVLLDGEDVTGAIRTPEVSDLVSQISAVPEIRTWMVEQQRLAAVDKNVVCEGRDIGTVVFPDAQVKIFLTADLEMRVQRRFRELSEKGIKLSPAEVMDNLNFRDEYDSKRAHSPLKKADDAIEIDTTDLTIQEEIDLVEKIARERLKLHPH
jgi:cytidylate kinase